jgi:NAD(P)H-hydrate epimerase
LKILTAKQSVRLDELSIKKHHIPAKELMRRAAQGCSEVLWKRKVLTKKSRTVIVCGPGNNGGDGLCMAGILRKQGYAVQVFFLGQVEKMSPESRYFYKILKPSPEELSTGPSSKKLRDALKNADVVVDALFGTGLNRKLTGRYAALVRSMNRSRGFKVAVDMPSGVSGETGRVLGPSFRADLTVTFEAPKWGQLMPDAWDYVGDLQVVPIGLSRSELQRMPAKAQWIDASWVKNFFSPRSYSIHKGAAGRVLVVAGSTKMPGAGYLTSLAALRAGAGAVTWAMPEEAFRKIKLIHPEVILQTLPSAGGRFTSMDLGRWRTLRKGFGALALGPGLGQGGGLAKFLKQILGDNPLPRVVDADGLNLLAANPTLLKYLKGAVLTPHPKEMSRLCGLSVRHVLKHGVEVAKNFAGKHRLWLLLKGYRSIIAGPRGELFVNSTGGPILATAGSGDVLTGTIASLLAQGLQARDAVTVGAYLHGRAGDLLAESYGDRGCLASEIAEKIPAAIRELLPPKQGKVKW